MTASCLYTKPTWEPTCSIWSCPGGECDAHLVLDMDDVRACYGSASELPDILADCADDWGDDECHLTVPAIAAQKSESPIQALSEADAESICAERSEWTWADDETMALSSLGYLLEEINQDCEITLLEEPWQDPCAVDPNATVTELALCPEEARLSAPPDAEFELLIDPDLSYVDVDLGQETVYTSLDGNAFAATNPGAEFLVALAWGENFTYGDDDYTQNHVVLSAPIQVNPSGGSFTVPVNQDFALAFQGVCEQSLYAVGIEPTVSSGGTFDTSLGSWSYHYAQAGSGTSVVVHLEGALVSLP